VLQSQIVCLCETGYDVVKAELVCACVCLCLCLSTYLSVDSTAVISAYVLCETGSVIDTKRTVVSVSVLGAFTELRKAIIGFIMFVLSVLLSAWNISAPT